MGVDISGGMIVGRPMGSINIPEDKLEELGMEKDDYLLEECEMDHMSPHYDSDSEDWIVGYKIKDVECWDRYGVEFSNWLDKLEELSAKFYEATGVKPYLIGYQHVY